MSDLKPIVLHGSSRGPNPWKVVIILEELGVPYQHILYDLAVVKQEPYLSLNPNGRVPTIEDPNTGITLWESGAIIEYLIDTYDKENKLSSQSFPEKWHEKQWLHFQMSGQGPYYGQAAWFRYLNPEKIPAAIKRYDEQVIRVVSVLDRALNGKEYLVGNRCTYADLSFLSWENVIESIYPDKDERTKDYPNYRAWIERLEARPAVIRYLELSKEAAEEAAKKAAK